MPDFIAIGQLLKDVAGVLDLDGVVACASEETWQIVLDEQLSMEAVMDPEGGKLVFIVELGVPAAGDVAPLHRRLLQYNYLWRETTGVRMAVDEPDGGIVMIYDLSLAGLDAILLQNVLQNLRAAAEAWKNLLVQPDRQAALAAGETTSIATPDMIRV